MWKFAATRKAGRQRRYCSQFQYCLLVLLVPMIVFLLGAGALTTQAHTNSSLFRTQQIETIPQQEIYVLGETFKLGNLQYKINSVGTSNGNGNIFKSPRSGNTFLLVDLTIENQGNTDIEVRSKIGFKLKDQDGKKQKSSLGATLAVKDAVNGTIKAGSKITGQLGYEVSKGAKAFELTVIPDPLSSKSRNASVLISLP
ncbi:DUF4352 domain-containing protein [Desulfosporosinus youngiae]|uniref:Telomeric repeat-binding factor 2 n=1 Tax=Desulfosporosinus youngiae DSM 17734 TaxID=768710 RepID=H5XY40_9FIRM|nr:DUF4352 domain-containing protein [Desulfosporosinus youngiae]EHQ91250.1 Telomeric repeat-binding factor 2 [Desulfosporosinus youngiae DSM 17734]